MTNIGNYFEILNFVILFLQKLYVYFYRGCCKKVPLMMNTILPPSPSPYHRRSNHLPCFAEAAAGPKEIILVLVAAPVGVGSGTSASAVLCEGGGGIDVTGEEKKGGPKDAATLLPRMDPLDRSALFIKGLYGFPGSFRFISLPIQG